MIKIWGTSFSLIGDLIMSLPQLNYFKNKYKDIYVNFVIHKKIAYCAPLFFNHPLIDKILISGEWSSFNKEDYNLASKCDVVTTKIDHDAKKLFDINSGNESPQVPLTVDYIIRYRNINDENFMGNPMYKLSLKPGIRHDNDNLPKLQLVRGKDDPGELIIKPGSLEGQVIIDQEPTALDKEHINFDPQTLSEDFYYLDTGEFELETVN